MSAPDRLPEEALDGLLDGSPSEGAVGTPLASYLARVREDARGTTPEPSQQLQMVLTEGLDPAELAEAAGAGTAAAGDQAGRGILSWRLRGRTLARVLVAKLAALGLLGKAAVAGAAVTVAASSAGAAGVLPPPAQDVFDDAIGREVQEAPADPDGQSDVSESDGETDVPADTQPETPADTSTTPPLDTDVSDDATGSDDSEPGVDGEDVAEDASDHATEAPEGTPGADASEEPPADADTGEEAVQEAPSDTTRSTELPAREYDGAGAVDQGGEPSREATSEPPTDGDSRD